MNLERKPDDIRQMQNGRWYWVEKRIIQEFTPQVNFLPMCVYHLLASMADQSQKCFPSQQYIANRLGCSRASVSRAIQNLRDLHLVQMTKEATTYPVYYLLQVPSNPDATGMHHERKKDVAPVNTNNTKQSIKNNNIVSDSLGQSMDREKILVREIADTVGEQNSEKFLPYVKQYDESFIRQVLFQVKQTKTIKKSRTALFIYLLNHYAK